MDTVLTIRQTAAALHVHKQTVYRLVWAGDLLWVNVGTGQGRPRIRIRQSAIEAFLKTRERAA